MAGNIYDDTLENLPARPRQPVPSPAPSSPVNIYDESIRQEQGDQETRMRRSLIQSADVTPEQAAEARRLSLRTGVPTSIIARHLPEYRQRDALAQPYGAIQQQTPHTAAWLEQPDNAAVAKDDLEQLGFLEWIVTAPQRAFTQTMNQQGFATLRYQSIFRDLTQAEHDQLESYRYQMDAGGALGAGKNWFKKAVTGSAGFSANQVPIAQYGITGATYGAVAGIAAGLAAGPAAPIVGPVTAVGAAAAGGAIGLLYGVLKSTFQQEAGNAFEEYSKVKDEFGQPLDPRVARVAALAVGAINAPIEAGAQEFLLKSIPGLDKLTGAAVRGAVKAALLKPTVRAALFEAGTDYFKTLGAEVGQEVVQRAVTILAGEVAKTAAPGPVQGQVTPGNVDLFQQPRVANADGSVSTVDSVSVNIDGKEVLLPTVTPDGRHFAGTLEEKSQQALEEYQRTGRHLGVFASEADATAFAAQLHQDYADGVYDQAGKYRGAGAIAQDLLSEGTGALQSFALGVLPGPLLGGLRMAHQARAAQRNEDFFMALGDGIANSKTMQRAPAAVRDFIATATKDGPVEKVYAPIDTWTTYWQSKQLDPAQIAAEVTGKADAYEQAVRTGEDLAIPTADYATKLAGTEHNAFFAKELRLAPEQMNAREAEAFAQQLQQQQAEVANAEVTAPQPAAPVRDAVLSQLVAAGVERSTAESYATLYESAFQTVAERAGVDPVKLFQHYGLTIQRPDLTGAGEGGSVVQDGHVQTGDTRGRGEPAQAGRAAEGSDRPSLEASGLPPADQDLITGIVSDAVNAGFDGDSNHLAAALAERAQIVREIDAEVHAAGGSPEELLRTIANGGGLGPDAGNPGEIAHLWESADKTIVHGRKARRGSAKFTRTHERNTGTLGGIKGVLSKDGLTLDGMVEFLGQDPRFAHIQTINDLLDELRGISSGATKGTAALSPERLGAAGDEWWKNILYQSLPADLVPVGEEAAANAERQAEMDAAHAAEMQQVDAVARAGEVDPLKASVREVRIANGTVKVLYQEALPGGVPPGQLAKGSFSTDTNTIRLLPHADLSTFLHETGHFWLEVLTDLVTKLPAEGLSEGQRQMQRDAQVLLDWFGHEGDAASWRALSTEQRRDAHEQFARGFEAYLMEGKAPSVALRAVFARFRAWLVGIYRSIQGLNVQLTDEVRGVFDRLVATDAAIADVQADAAIAPMFTDARAAGMSDEEFAAYRATVAKASTAAQETLQTKLLSDVQREQTARWKAQREAIRATVETEVHQQPVYQALAAFRKGTLPDGSPLIAGAEPAPLKLSRQAIVDEFGEARLKTLPKPFVYAKDGELTPAAAAELFGFSSGDELLTAIAASRPMARVIEQETERRMFAAHGSLLLDGTIHERAQAAMANQDREQVIHAELRALTKLQQTVAPHLRVAERQAERERAYERRWLEAEAKLRIAIAEGRKQVEIDALRGDVARLKAQAKSGPAVIAGAIPPTALITHAARTRIAQTVIREFTPQVFWSAAMRAGREAVAAAARQDFDRAITAQQQQLLNLALYRETARAKEDVEARVAAAKALDGPASRKRVGLAGESYQDQIDGILDRYEFAAVSKKALGRRASLRKWVAALEADGLPVELPESLLDDARRVNYQELTYEGFVGVTDGLAQIAHLASLKNKLLKSAESRDFDEVRQEVATSIREHNVTRPAPLEFRPADDRKRSVADWFASHRKIAMLARALDGYQDGGAFWNAIIRPLNAAADAEVARKQIEAARYAAILEEHYPGRELATLGDKVFIPAIQASLSKEARLAVALNWGNEDNRERLVNDPRRQWTRASVEAIFNTLDARDWNFVQATWDFEDSFWPEIKAKQERVTGTAPEKVQAAPFATRFGQQMRGGYHHIAYDSRLTIRGQQHEAATEAKLATAAAYVQQTTRRGHVEARQQNVQLSLRLDLGVVFNHVEQVVHDLTHHETLSDVTRLLRDSAVSRAILETQGDQVYQQFTTALQDIAVGSMPARNIMDRAATFLRTRTQLALLGWNLWTAAQQPLGLFNGASRVGPRWVAKGMSRWLRDAASMESTAAWIADVSPMMKARVVTATQDLNDLRNTMRQPGGWFDGLLRELTWDKVTKDTFLDSYLWHIGLMQRVADIPTWLGQYEKSMAAGETEARAIAIADQAVLDSQGGGQIKDLAQIQRGSPVAKMFLTFYSYGNTVYNATADVAGATNFKSPASVGKFLGHLSLLYLMPALGTVTFGHLLGKMGDGDDWTDWLKEVGGEVLSTALNTMVFVREFTSLVGEGTRGYAGPAGARTFQLIYQLGNQIKQGELDESLWKAANATAGALFGFPAAQVQRTIDGWVALEEGRSQNPAVLLTGPPPKGKN